MDRRKAAKRGSSKQGNRGAVKNTHPPSISRREPEKKTSGRSKLGRKYDAFPDRVDVRDWFYQPTLSPLPDSLLNCHLVPEILDQGQEGACTGFALAAVINFHLAQRKLDRRISPRMLYEMARRYDEWPGEEYEGSSARGAMKGWASHGVCTVKSWPQQAARQSLSEELAIEAQLTPGGAYYRVMHRNIRDMHAALTEVGILYVTLMVHDGWDRPGPLHVKVPYHAEGKAKSLELPVIQRDGRAESGHAVAIVGYTEEGFIIQNSWGRSWGKGGFALLPYEDYMLHATDVWVAQLGVPIQMTTWKQSDAGDSLIGLHRAARAIPLSEVRPYVIDIGNNGELSGSGAYWTTKEDVRRLFEEVIPQATANWSKRRVALYLHGGLNSEKAVAERIVAYRDVMLANQIYPLHVMWETGLGETLGGIVKDLFTDADERAGSVADWMNKLREGLIEAKDRSIELTLAGPGGALWREMKENARLASAAGGGMQLVAQYAAAALGQLSAADRASWEVHVVGHSAGSIFAAHALQHLIALGASLKTIQFMAPAITIEAFEQLVLPHVDKRSCPLPSLYLLSDDGERDDDVGPYGKSLLYLVSNAFEPVRRKPLLGMEAFVRENRELAKRYAKKIDGRAALVIAGAGKSAGGRSQSDSHGGFDNDAATLNSVLQRILNEAPKRAFTDRDLQFEGKVGSAPASSERRRASSRRVAGLRSAPANTQSNGASARRGGRLA